MASTGKVRIIENPKYSFVLKHLIQVFVKELCKSPLNPISSHIWTQATLTSIQWIKTEPHQMTCPDGTNISRMHQATWHLTRVFRSLHSSHTTLLIYLLIHIYSPCVGRLLKTIQQLLFTLTSLYLLLYKYFNHWAIFFVKRSITILCCLPILHFLNICKIFNICIRYSPIVVSTFV